MERVKSENGYTLLITLGLIMMMMLFMFAFTRIAVSQKAQVEKTDMSIVTTALAEMGAEYYKEQIISDINSMIVTTTQEMQAIKNQNLGYTALTAEMQELAAEKNNALSLYYASNYYVEQTTTPAEIKVGYTTLVESPGRGYRLIERSSFDPATETLSLKVVGFTEDEESEPIQVDLKVPSQLMWQGDKTEKFTSTFTFQEYATKNFEGTKIESNAVSMPSGDSYNFTSHEFYYFTQGAVFNHQQFGDGASLDGINVLSGGTLTFNKHVEIADSKIIGKTINVDFSSKAQTEISNSRIIANRLNITKSTDSEDVDPITGNINEAQKVDFQDNSSICLIRNPDTTSAETYALNIENLKKVLLFKDTSKLIYKKPDNYWYYYELGVERVVPSPQNSNAIVLDACNFMLEGTETLKVYEAYDPDNMRISDVIYQ